jgi:spore coat protein CotH
MVRTGAPSNPFVVRQVHPFLLLSLIWTLPLSCSSGDREHEVRYVGSPEGGASSGSSAGGRVLVGSGGAASAGSGGLGDEPRGGDGSGANQSSGGGKATDPLIPEPDGPITLNIEVSEEDLAILEADPWLAPDVPATFIDGAGNRYEGIETNYRGAYQLGNLIENGSRRNWKLKFGKEQPYQDRREWNLNYEPHLRQRLAYALLDEAGVRVPKAEHVLLKINGETQGVYLRYADPDSKGWLSDAFGSDEGDLFKAAHDLPGETPYFATMEVLGSSDEDYFLHFNKKLNKSGDAATDFSQLRTFIAALNETHDDEFPSWLLDNFDVERFTSFLVVSSFMCNWDTYPYRPKNFWLYQHPDSGEWSFIPWDLDATFQSWPSPNYPLGIESSIFQEFDSFEGREAVIDAEGTERPLVRRMMAVSEFREAYVRRYQELVGGILSEQSLMDRVQRLQDEVKELAPEGDQEDLNDNFGEVVQFIGERSELVGQELANDG